MLLKPSGGWLAETVALQAGLHQAAETVVVELAHDAAGEHRDLVGLDVVDDSLPVDAGGADRVGRGDHRHLQAARVEAQLYSSPGSKPVGSWPADFTVSAR